MNKRTKKRSLDIFSVLGFTSKERREKMTNEDWKNFNNSYQEKYGISFQEDLEIPDEEEPVTTQGAVQEPAISPELQSQVLAALNEVAEISGTQAPAAAPADSNNALAQMLGAINTVLNQNRDLVGQAEPTAPATVIPASGIALNTQTFARVMGHTPHTQNYLFGIENQFFKRNTWWGELVATGKGQEYYTSEDAETFAKEFKNYSETFAQRCRELVGSNQIGILDYNKMIHGESMVDYSRMNEKLGEYTVRRMDMIIAYLRTLKSVSDIFPVVPYIQNKATAPTAFFEELSQSFQSGYIFKGAVDFDGEIYHVDNVMFKFQFESPKDLEKAYIGYMNREGSNPMKWTLFEWCIVHFSTLLFNEQQRRRVLGCRVPRQGDFPQPALFAADGALRAIQRVEEEFKVWPFTQFKQYTESTVLDYVRSFWAAVSMTIPSMNGMRLYMNEKHHLWYIDAYNAKYGQNADYKGPNSKIRYYSPDDIIWVPNMSLNDYKMWITYERNVEVYEDIPGEMYSKFYFEQRMEQLALASWWKEGAGVLAPGVQFNSLENLQNSGRKMQWLFTNYPVVDIAADATTIDVSQGYEFLTGENTAATALTDITNAATDRVYKIICGSTTNATTIAKSGKFAKITAAWTPTAEGDYIKLYAELEETTKTVNGKQRKVVQATGNFLELERKVS